MISLKEAEKFHGHLGPWLVLGILMGEFALKMLKAKKYFGLKVKVWGADRKPQSCLIDGLQLACGATYGKGNIQKIRGARIKIIFRKLKNKQKIEVSLKEDLMRRLNALKGHRDSKALAKKLYQEKNYGAFRIRYL